MASQAVAAAPASASASSASASASASSAQSPPADTAIGSVTSAKSADFDPYPAATKFFGFSTEALIDDVYNAAHDYISDAVDEMVAKVLQSLPPESASKRTPDKRKRKQFREALEKRGDELVHLLRHYVAKNFDLFEMYSFRNLLDVPQSIADATAAGADEEEEEDTTTAVAAPSTAYTAADEAALDERLQRLRLRVVQQRRKRMRLRRLVATYEASLPTFAEGASRIDAIHAALEEHRVWPPADAATTLVGKAEALSAYTTAMNGMRPPAGASLRTARDQRPGAEAMLQAFGAAQTSVGQPSLDEATALARHLKNAGSASASSSSSSSAAASSSS